MQGRVNCCKCMETATPQPGRTMRNMTVHYANLISPLLLYNENNIIEALKPVLETEPGFCKEKEIPVCEKDNERQFIFNVTCRLGRYTRHFRLHALMAVILGSLECDCPTRESKQYHHHWGKIGKLESRDTVVKEVDNEKTQRGEDTTVRSNTNDTERKQKKRLCVVKRFLESLKLCFMSLMERYGDQT
ncbi:hypothetical protein DPEC_G00079310 [Dallia pectoralis]|uniref:Uncharacterized protein n=1 Tax=Dallia pectoralis TaxID=75939 RepID=A0ACC2H565_DALPE|nr:hypothetical protein DPEC_G00079310 [Dallia pectoralis]